MPNNLTSTQRTHVRVGSLNCAGKAAAATQQLHNLLTSTSVDILGLQEVKNSRDLDVPGYAWLSGLPPHERPKHHFKGLGALVKLDLKSRVTVASVNVAQEFMWLKLTGSNDARDTFICYLYCLHAGHSDTKREAFYAELLDSCTQFNLTGDVLLLGDFNARLGAVSGDKGTNQNGPLLLDFLRSAFSDGQDNHFQCLLNSTFGCQGFPTFAKRGQQSIIDYAITGPESLSRIARVHIETKVQKLGANALGSDHHLIFADWRLTIETPSPPSRKSRLVWDKTRLQEPEIQQAR